MATGGCLTMGNKHRRLLLRKARRKARREHVKKVHDWLERVFKR